MNQNSLKKKLLLIMILSSGLIGGLISSYAESHAARVQAVEQTKNVAWELSPILTEDSLSMELLLTQF